MTAYLNEADIEIVSVYYSTSLGYENAYGQTCPIHEVPGRKS
jgi:hypothetical protein